MCRAIALYHDTIHIDVGGEQKEIKMKTVASLALVLALCSSAALADGPGGPPPLQGLPPPQGAIHNGSLVSVLSLPNGGMQIQYVQPRVGMLEVGVRPGTILVQGRWGGPPPGIMTGTAFVFSGICPPTPYRVEGSIAPDGSLVLTGPAPVVDPSSCGVLGLVPPENSVLVFQQLGAPPPPPMAYLPPPPYIPRERGVPVPYGAQPAPGW